MQHKQPTKKFSYKNWLRTLKDRFIIALFNQPRRDAERTKAIQAEFIRRLKLGEPNFLRVALKGRDLVPPQIEQSAVITVNNSPVEPKANRLKSKPGRYAHENNPNQ